MENAVNSMKILKDNIEPNLVGNYLEGVTTRVEPKARVMAIITHSIESNPIEKRSAPDKKGDEIVWSKRERLERGGNDLATFGTIYFNMARTAIRNQVIEMISRFPITTKQNVRADMMNIQSLTELGFNQSAKLASIVIPLASLRRLLTPILTTVTLYVALISPSIGITFCSSTPPNHTLSRAIFAGSLSSKIRKGFTTIWTNLSNCTFIARIILTSVYSTTKLQKALSAASLFSKRPFGDRLTTDNTGFELLFSCAIAFPRTVFIVLYRKFLATNYAEFHTPIIS